MRFEENEKYIRKDLEGSITRSMNAAFLKRWPKAPEEPDFIAELVYSIPRDLYNSLKVYAPNYQIAVSGVFCHQKPLADFGSEPNPEIGDILLVYIEENRYEVTKCNALLMQAKVINEAPYIIGMREKHQRILYEEWPKFKLKRAGRLDGTKIDVQPKTLNPGAQYLLLQPPYKDEKKVCCAYPDKKLLPEKKLSEQIIDLMKFFTGRTFALEPYLREYDGWSDLIVKMISNSGVSHFNRRYSGFINAERQQTFGEEDLLASINRRIDVRDYESLVGEDSQGLPCVLIYAREGDEMTRR